ncbi:MAG: arsenic resistance N-acetyltransferase ArsN2 [Gemmatimonadaceae bacterium]
MRDFFLRRAREDDLESVLALLAAGKLPVDGVADGFGNFVVAEGGLSAIGAAGMEVYGKYALLRSAIVAPAWQGYGVGRALVGEVISRARARNVDILYLLTTTAENYFPSFGFERVERSEVPDELGESAELKGACPATATVMRLYLQGNGRR